MLAWTATFELLDPANWRWKNEKVIPKEAG